LILWLAEGNKFFEKSKFNFYFILFFLAGTFFTYCGMSLIGMVFVQIFIQETKNKSLVEIQEIYQKKFNIIKLNST
jgi:hypothetical protein